MTTKKNQLGFSLAVSLVVVLVISILAVASMKMGVFGTKSSTSFRIRSAEFQAAEAGLREAELIAGTNPAIPPLGCVNGICAAPLPNATPVWQDANIDWATTTSDLGGGTAGQPEYLIEFMGLAPSWPRCDSFVPIDPICMTPRYRITSRSSDGGRNMVVLQSHVAARTP